MKKIIKKILNKWYIVIIVILSISTLSLAIACRYIFNYHYIAVPSQADLKLSVDSSFNEVSNFKCDYYGRFNYGKMTYKYTCSFDYTKENEETNNSYKTCVECVVKGKKWQCGISTSECFK